MRAGFRDSHETCGSRSIRRGPARSRESGSGFRVLRRGKSAARDLQLGILQKRVADSRLMGTYRYLSAVSGVRLYSEGWLMGVDAPSSLGISRWKQRSFKHRPRDAPKREADPAHERFLFLPRYSITSPPRKGLGASGGRTSGLAAQRSAKIPLLKPDHSCCWRCFTLLLLPPPVKLRVYPSTLP